MHDSMNLVIIMTRGSSARDVPGCCIAATDPRDGKPLLNFGTLSPTFAQKTPAMIAAIYDNKFVKNSHGKRFEPLNSCNGKFVRPCSGFYIRALDKENLL